MHLKGKCEKGSACEFWHSPPCAHFQQRNCDQGSKCQFKHIKAKSKAAPAGGNSASDTPATPKKKAADKKKAQKKEQTNSATAEGGTGSAPSNAKAQLISSKKFTVPSLAFFASSIFAVTQPVSSLYLGCSQPWEMPRMSFLGNVSGPEASRINHYCGIFQGEEQSSQCEDSFLASSQRQALVKFWPSDFEAC